MKENKDKDEDGDYGQEYGDDGGCDDQVVDGIPEPRHGCKNGFGLQYRSCLMSNTITQTKNGTRITLTS